MVVPSPKDDDPRKIVLHGLMRADSMVQIAIAVPLSTLIGWGSGVWLDNKLHQSWIGVAGIALGAVAGFVQVIRVASQANRSDDH
ncbi:MAG TPA: AtpZ/AtpI family protein [Acidobacteriaceae bacterium]|nr:AtpZ/AtpI family protein [Acidobacteriaceae bacterium]